ncbi:LacI family DNA-binding transcriptional regulator [Brachybacterium fresconis]|uniref:LacI family transcriptional regulator n=1 Tax=Brachybacterium fresconis TaxID=173363 RepID=A0ABS4YHR2_9MICO|nr:LacI family DNA-binding transcriptional regulator [Brachybacterium fresconis]MBP2408333.1 LacI family transcriptional regulator [Brachybacterium fresconis]
MMANGASSPGPTIYSVAARAGVSIATVSRVFADSAKVAPRTRDTVLAAARDLRYVPAAAARALAVRRSKALGVVLPHIDGPYYAELLVGFEVAASELGLSVVLALATPQEKNPSAVLDLLGRVDGIAFMARSGADDELVAQVANLRPTVSVARGQLEGVDAFYAENRETARRLTTHLIDHGRRRIGFVGDPEDGSDIGRRHRGYLDALESAGLAPGRHLRADPVEQAGIAIAESLLSAGRADAAAVPAATGVVDGAVEVGGAAASDGSDEIGGTAAPDGADGAGGPAGPVGTGLAGLDALVCGNDELAMAIIARLTAAGVDVPGDLAVTGWDDTVTARYLTPGLTTVRQDVAELGALAAHRLAARIDGEEAQRPVTVGSSVVLRRSCGCPPAGVAP